MYVDVFAAGTGRWYEFKCEEKAFIKDIIEEMYFAINYLEEEKKNENKDKNEEQKENPNKNQNKNRERDYKMKGYRLSELSLNLICIESQEILNKYKKLKDCAVENGDRLILI